MRREWSDEQESGNDGEARPEARACDGDGRAERADDPPEQSSSEVPPEPLKALVLGLAAELAALKSSQEQLLLSVDSVDGNVAQLRKDFGRMVTAMEGADDLLFGASGSLQSSSLRRRSLRKRNTVYGDELPKDWPQSLVMRFAEKPDNPEEQEELAPRRLAGSVVVQHLSSNSNPQTSGNSTRQSEVGFIEKHLIIDPDSKIHVLSGCIACIALQWDLTVIPYALAWGIPFAGTMAILSIAVTGFWTLELTMGFFTGFHRNNGELITEPCQVSRHYIRGYFVLDASTVLCDWVTTASMILEQTARKSSLLKMVRFIKMGRFLRLLAMFRVLKGVRAFEDLMYKHLSESHRLCLQVVALFVGICWVAHLLTCCWYAIGVYGYSDTGMRWIAYANTAAGEDWSSSQFFVYATCFHWSISQVTLGAMDVYSYNSLERVFSVICLLCGFLCGSVLVSSLSATMVEVQVTRRERHQMLRQLRRFLSENKIKGRISVLVQRQCTERLGENDQVECRDVAALQLLSDSLRGELLYQYFKPFFILHPLFRLCHNMELPLVRSICSSELEMRVLRPKDDLFMTGPARVAIYMLANGEMTYYQCPEKSRNDHPSSDPVWQSQWLAEAALWSHWTHVGNANADAWCTVLEVPDRAVQGIISKKGVLRNITLDYCRLFHQRLAAAYPPLAEWPTDLRVPFTEYGEIVGSMSDELQIVIGHSALQQMPKQQQWRVGSSRIKDLTRQVEEGRCTIMVSGEGQVERVTSVLVLQIVFGEPPRNEAEAEEEAPPDTAEVGARRLGKPGFWKLLSNVETSVGFLDSANSLDDTPGDRFVHLAKEHEDGRMHPSCKLPGGKQSRGEAPEAAIRRILHTKLWPFVGKLGNISKKRCVEWGVSKEYGLRTKYLITVCKTQLAEVNFSPPTPTRGLSPAEVARIVGSPDGSRLEVDLDIRTLGLTVFLVESNPGKRAYYAWLSRKDFDYLRGAKGDAVLAGLVEEAERHFARQAAASGEVGLASGDNVQEAGVGDGSLGRPPATRRPQVFVVEGLVQPHRTSPTGSFNVVNL